MLIHILEVKKKKEYYYRFYKDNFIVFIFYAKSSSYNRYVSDILKLISEIMCVYDSQLRFYL